MRNLNIGGNWMDEFVKIASDKGWVTKEAEGFTPKTPEWMSEAGEPKVAPENSPEDLTAGDYLKKEPVAPDVEMFNKLVNSGMDVEKARELVRAKFYGKWEPKTPEWSKGPVPAAPRVAPENSPEDLTAGDYLKQSEKSASLVVSELITLANDLDNMGETKAAIAVDSQIKFYKEALDKLYDITGETGDQLVGQAHPGGGPTLVPAKDEGGKVETIVEEHKKVVDKATKAPTGKYAALVMNLIATANNLDEQGRSEEAKIVDQTLKDLLEAPPFVNRSSASETAGSEDLKLSGLKKEADINLDQASTLDGMLFKFSDLLDTLEKSVQNQSSLVIIPNLGKKALEGSIYSIPSMGMWKNRLYMYDDYITKCRKEINGWRSDLRSWKQPLFANIPWILQKFSEWEKVFEIIQKYYKSFPKNVNGSWDDSFFLKWYGTVQQLKKLALGKVQPTLPVKNEKVEQKKSPKTLDEARALKTKQFADIYVGELNKLKTLLYANTAKFDKVLGKETVSKLDKWIQNRIYNVAKGGTYSFAPKAKSVENIKKYISTLESKISKASENVNIFKMSDGRSDVPSFGTKPAVKTPSKVAPKGGYRPAKKADPMVKQTQQALMSYYGPNAVGPRKDDGQWGPATMASFNKLMGELKQYGVNFIARSARPEDKYLNYPAKVIPILKRRKASQTASGANLPNDLQVPYGNMVFNLNDLRDANSFLAAISVDKSPLQLNPYAKASLKIAGSDLKDPFRNDSKEKAFEMLKDLYKKLISDKEYRDSLFLKNMSKGVSANVANQVANVVKNTLIQIYKEIKSDPTVVSKTAPGATSQTGAGKTSKKVSFADWVSSLNPSIKLDLSTPDKLRIAANKLLPISYLGNFREFIGIAIAASRYDKSLRDSKPDVKFGEEDNIMKFAIANKLLNRLMIKFNDINYAAAVLYGSFKSEMGGKTGYEKLRRWLAEYSASLNQMKSKLGQ